MENKHIVRALFLLLTQKTNEEFDKFISELCHQFKENCSRLVDNIECAVDLMSVCDTSRDQIIENRLVIFKKLKDMLRESFEMEANVSSSSSLVSVYQEKQLLSPHKTVANSTENSFCSILDKYAIFSDESPVQLSACSFDIAEKSIEKAIEGVAILRENVEKRACENWTIYHDQISISSTGSMQWDEFVPPSLAGKNRQQSIHFDALNECHESLCQQQVNELNEPSISYDISFTEHVFEEITSPQILQPVQFKMPELLPSAHEAEEFNLPLEWIVATRGESFVSAYCQSPNPSAVPPTPFQLPELPGALAIEDFRLPSECLICGHQCPFCEKKFRRIAILKTHISHLQSDFTCSKKSYSSKKYVCQICPKKFKSKSSLKQHTRYQHDNQRVAYPHICAICNLTYRTRHSLRRHANIHLRRARFHVQSVFQ